MTLVIVPGMHRGVMTEGYGSVEKSEMLMYESLVKLTGLTLTGGKTVSVALFVMTVQGELISMV